MCSHCNCPRATRGVIDGERQAMVGKDGGARARAARHCAHLSMVSAILMVLCALAMARSTFLRTSQPFVFVLCNHVRPRHLDQDQDRTHAYVHACTQVGMHGHQ